MLTEFAAAKINLCLHVTGRRTDGYHLLDSIAVFAGAGDGLRAEEAETMSLDITGPFGAGLSTAADNLVLRAAAALRARLIQPRGARIHLEKYLPVASGIGGGSADAAAALRLLCALWQAPATVRAECASIALSLGADVPVCLDSAPARMRGIGEQIERVAIPSFGLLLINPGVSVSTATVFQAFRAGDRPWSPPFDLAAWPDAVSLAAWLRGTRNDLEEPACAVCPAISDVLSAIAATPDCLLARMSGSGATCFGLYRTAQQATAAADVVSRRGWWVWAGTVPSSSH